MPSSLQLACQDPITTATADGLLAQFKANPPAEIDSDSDCHDKRRRSYSREQKLGAVGYAKGMVKLRPYARVD
jgi:hypothetical protein